MKDSRPSVVKRHLEGEEKTAQQITNMIRVVKAKKTTKASLKKRTHQWSLKGRGLNLYLFTNRGRKGS